MSRAQIFIVLGCDWLEDALQFCAREPAKTRTTLPRARLNQRRYNDKKVKQFLNPREFFSLKGAQILYFELNFNVSILIS